MALTDEVNHRLTIQTERLIIRLRVEDDVEDLVIRHSKDHHGKGYGTEA